MPPFALVLCAAAAVLGSLAATAQELPLDVRAVVAIGLAALGAIALSGAYRAPRLRALLAISLVASAANAVRVSRSEPAIAPQRTASYAGTALERTASGFVAVLDGNVRVLVHATGEPPPPGSRIVARGRLTPFDDARNPGEPSERAIARDRGLDAQIESAAVLSVAPGSPWDVRAWPGRAHEWAHAQLASRLAEPSASVVAGELWGERAALPPDLREEFQETGTVHVLVTAGLHVGAVAALILGLLSLFALPRTTACALAVAGIWAFAWFSGGALPAVRAATMATAALCARASGRATFSWNALAIAAIVIAFVRPQSVATASFALSFSCVGAIFACANAIEGWIERNTSLPARVREALVLSLATQCGTWPLTAAVFLQFAPYAALANLVVVPCVAATMALGALQLAFVWSAPLAQAAANINSWPLALMLGTVRTLSSLPGARIAMTPAPAWCILAYDAALATAPLLFRRGAQTLAVAALIFSTAFVLEPPRWARGLLRITVVDVGQADAIALQTPGGHALLIDAGGRLERGAPGADSAAEAIGERIVVPLLLRDGVHALDAVILSHPHGDHAGGVAPVLRRLRVAAFADGGQRYGGHAYQDALATARSEGVPIAYPLAGARWRFDDGVSLDFIGPSLPLIARSRNDVNENSIAFILRYRSFCMLFTGDAGAAAERRFLSEGVDLRCDVLKVGHHGSAYGSTPEFIAAVRPRYAIVSVGRHNLFGHPAPATIATLQHYGATIYRTDLNGAIDIESDGAQTSISTMVR